MKSLLSLMMVTAIMVSAADAQPPLPMADGHAAGQDGHVAGQAVELFHCVEIEDPDHIAPCAVPKIIMVPDPCACRHHCGCCDTKCVAVKICVPPPNPCACGCGAHEEVKIRKGGRKQKYDYGEYSVEVTVKDGYVKVDYDD